MTTHSPRVCVSPARASRVLTPLLNATEEKDVEHIWRTLITDGLKKASKTDGGSIGSGFTSTVNKVKTDGYLTVNTPNNGEYSLLLEAKFNKDLTGVSGLDNRARTLCQVVYYIHNLTSGDDGVPVPEVVMVATEKETFLIDSTPLVSLAQETWSEDPNWEATPSRAHEINLPLYARIKGLPEVATVPVYQVFSDSNSIDLDASHLIHLIHSIGVGGNTEALRPRVKAADLEKLFTRFHMSVFSGVVKRGLSKKQMAVFVKTILGDDALKVKDPRRNTCTITASNGSIVTVNASDGFNAAEHSAWKKKHMCGGYSNQEVQEITSICDRLLEDAERRWTGEFWTPEIWANQMRKMLSSNLGDDWTSKYTIWDPACGSKNLTQATSFGASGRNENLYLSTLFEEELSISEGINPGATVFQWDFLNDSITTEDGYNLPMGLVEALQNNHPIIILGNPPYGSSGDPRSINKTGVADSTTKRLMVKAGAGGHAAQELYAQFYYRAATLARTYGYTSDFHIVFFSKVFMSSPSYKRFLDDLTSDFKFQGGFMLNSGEFSGATSKFPVVCSHWTLDTSDSHIPQREFTFRVLKTSRTKNTVSVVDSGLKTIKHVDDSDRLSRMIPPPSGSLIDDYPVTVNGFHDSNSGEVRGRFTDQAFGYLQKRDSVGGSYLRTAMLSTARRHGDGVAVTPSNFSEACMVMGILKSCFIHIRSNKELWVRDKDIFRKLPESFTSTSEYEKFKTDCVVYSLFTTGSYQTALKDYKSRNKTWNIHNEFFPLSVDFMTSVAKDNLGDGGEEVLEDIKSEGHRDRYTATWIREQEKNKTISSASLALLDTWKKIVAKSFKYRIQYANTPLRTEYGVDNWDAGYMQIHRMCFSDDRFLLEAKIDKELQALWKTFSKQHSELGNSIYQTYTTQSRF